MKSFALAEPLLEALAPFEQQIDAAFVFGSIAKGTDTHRSGIDLVVVGDVPLMASTDAMFSMEQAIGRPLHLNLYTQAEWASLRPMCPVLAQISEASKIRILLRSTLN